jgi:lipoprotein LpqH
MRKGKPVKRILAAAVGLIGCATLLVGCSDHPSSVHTSNPSASVATGGGGTEVKVDGKDLPGLDLNTVTCVKQAGNIDIASGAINGRQGLAVMMTDATAPKVESLSMFVDGNALAVSHNMGAQVGSADVVVNGKTYTITGQAQGADLKNPMAGTISKKFSIKVSC